eukprot:Gb_33611 [translate_table: standard]
MSRSDRLRIVQVIRSAKMSTITVPVPTPSPTEDCEQLRKAVEGWGTNEKLIIEILGHRTAAQRKIIRQTYSQLYGEDLLKRLDSELSMDFEKAVLLWTLDPAERDARLAHEAIRKWSPKNRSLLEISCAQSSIELLLVRQAYHVRYKKSLEEEIASHTNGDFRKLSISLSSFLYLPDAPLYCGVYPRLAEGTLSPKIYLNQCMFQHCLVTHVTFKLLLLWQYSDQTILCTIEKVWPLSGWNPTRICIIKQGNNLPCLIMHILGGFQPDHSPENLKGVATILLASFQTLELLVALASSYRYEGPEVDTRLAISEAKQLHEAIKEKAVTHEELIRILSTRSKAQLNATFNRYKDEYGHHINKMLNLGNCLSLTFTIRSSQDRQWSSFPYKHAYFLLTIWVMSLSRVEGFEDAAPNNNQDEFGCEHQENCWHLETILCLVIKFTKVVCLGLMNLPLGLLQGVLAILLSPISHHKDFHQELTKENLVKVCKPSLQGLRTWGAPCIGCAGVHSGAPAGTQRLGCIATHPNTLGAYQGAHSMDRVCTLIKTTDFMVPLKLTARGVECTAPISCLKALKNETPDDFKDALRTVIKCICFPEKYFAKVLRLSIDKLGTDEGALTRVVVTRAEIDMKGIKEQYFKRTSKTLEHAIAAETSGDYRDFLLTLIGQGHA